MKKFLLITILMLSLSGLRAADDETVVNSRLQAVTVYLSGAQVERSGSAVLSPGEHTVVFSNVSANIDPNSVQAAAPNGAIIQMVSQRTNYLEREKLNPKIRLLTDSLNYFQLENAKLQNQKTVLNEEKSMILTNKSLAGENNGVVVSELEKAAAFFRSRLTNIYDELFKIGAKERKIQERQQAINQQLRELNYKAGKPTYEVVVKVYAERAGKYEIGLKYFTQAARWVPRYDLRATDTDSPVNLDFNADVYQNTGVDWENVPLSLSTGNPNVSGTPPELGIWNLYLIEPPKKRSMVLSKSKGSVQQEQRSQMYKDAAPVAQDDYDLAGEIDEEPSYSFDNSASLSDYTTVEYASTTTIYEIGMKTTVPSDNKSHQVSIRKLRLPAFYEHFAIPKLDPDAFLMAGITGWDTLSLVAGTASIFFEGAFLGQTVLDPANTADTMYVSLGRDKSVKIQREQLRNFTTTRVFGANKECSYAYRFNVRNTKRSAIKITIEDQIPISQSDDINVKLEEDSGASLDKERGKLTWDLTVKPAETKTFDLKFSVKHPKNKRVRGL